MYAFYGIFKAAVNKYINTQAHTHTHTHTHTLPAIALMSRVFANGPGDQCSLPGWVITKTKKMILDVSLLSPQHYKVRIKGKIEQSRE